jgi:hypothetical protein
VHGRRDLRQVGHTVKIDTKYKQHTQTYARKTGWAPASTMCLACLAPLYLKRLAVSIKSP